MAILDIHTHHAAPYPEGVVCADIDSFVPMESQLYSLGIHPWSEVDFDPLFERLEKLAAAAPVVAVGECGIDMVKGGPMYEQLLHFKRHVDLSEQLKKPLVIHDVKAHDMIIGCRRDLNPKMPWVIHGFRGKPTVAKMLVDAGCMLSFGEKFNPETLRSVPEDFILAETDESSLCIDEIIERLSEGAGKKLRDIILVNTDRVLFPLKH